MSNSLYTGVSGLLAHQRKLDVVANNLANLNTLGYKSQQMSFTDLIYSDVTPAAGTSDGRIGGRNPSQIGNGVKVSQISRKLKQGVLQTTGESLDFAISGEGYFAVSDGVNRFFTRDGSFTINSAGYLVSPATGNIVLREGNLGEPTETNVGFQRLGDPGIFIPLGNSIPGSATTVGAFSGNLPTNAVPPRAEVQTSANPYRVSGSPATLTTLLNNLDTNTADYVTGDSLSITGADVDGTPFSITLPVNGTTTMGDLVNAINGQLSQAEATLEPNGQLVLRAFDVGTSLLNVNIADANTNTGSTNHEAHDLRSSTIGKFGDRFFTTVQIYDERGQAQTLTAEFEKETNDEWNLRLSLTNNNGTFIDDRVLGVEFNNDGTFRRVNGVGVDGNSIEIDFDGISNNQSINLDFSKLTHTPSDFGTSFDQDGFPTGILTSIAVNSKGILEAIATNGRRISVAQLAITSFRNPQGLASRGNNYFVETIASGAAQIGSGLTNGRGEVVGGNLEQSNVDIAYEFTQLIVAQRGFSANARTITVTDNVLQELTNIVR